MAYNVGPNHKRSASDKQRCPGCNESVYPEWNGHEGIFECPVCDRELEVESEQ